jgi:hypothetical protein
MLKIGFEHFRYRAAIRHNDVAPMPRANPIRDRYALFALDYFAVVALILDACADGVHGSSSRGGSFRHRNAVSLDAIRVLPVGFRCFDGVNASVVLPIDRHPLALLVLWSGADFNTVDLLRFHGVLSLVKVRLPFMESTLPRDASYRFLLPEAAHPHSSHSQQPHTSAGAGSGKGTNFGAP